MPEEVQVPVADATPAPVAPEVTPTEGTPHATPQAETAIQQEVQSLDAAIRKVGGTPPADTKADNAPEEGAPAQPTPKTRVTPTERRIQQAEERASAAEQQLTDLQKQISELQTARQRQEAEERAGELEGQLAELTLELEKAQAAAKGLVSPEEARSRANAAAAEARRRAEAKATDAEAALKAQEEQKTTELTAVQQRLAEVERELAERQEQIEVQKRSARENAAIVALQSAGLRADSIPYAKMLLSTLLSEETNLDDDGDRAQFIGAFKDQHRVFFGNQGTTQIPTGVPVQPMTTPATGQSMNAFIREVSGRVG